MGGRRWWRVVGRSGDERRGRRGAEPIYDDVPFEDDHVEFRVPRIEREIAAEEIGGEEPWTRVASRGVFEDDAALPKDRAARERRATTRRSVDDDTRTPTRRGTSNTQNRIIGIIANATTTTMTKMTPYPLER